ncbi:MAG: hypothetical protein JXB15_09090 [Anaerolineales bacterium]|nr:hypothetical protein [Anaerolineales bacterium]
MMDKEPLALHLYSTRSLITTLLGLILLGVLLLFGLQQIWMIPTWIQYLLLTGLIMAAFAASSCLAARPAQVHLAEHSLTIEQKSKAARVIPLEDVEAYAYYAELLLYSLKISLRSKETLSIIQFKWDKKSDFQAFFKQFESLLASSGGGLVSRSETFYHSPAKVVIAAGLFILYAAAVIILLARDAFASWNPIWSYFFWVLPAAFFIKMWKAK